MRPVAAGLLKGLLDAAMPDTINFINAPLVARDHGLKISRSIGLGSPDYINQITCRVQWADGERTVSGAVFAEDKGRIVQVSGYRFEANPTGIVLLMLNDDVPGVVGAVGNVLGDYHINIAEWRLGRDVGRNEALSFINLDSDPPEDVLEALRALEAVTKATIIRL